MTAAVLISFLFVRRGTERVYVRGEFGLYTGVSKREIWRMFLEPVLAVVVAARMMTKTVLIFRTEYLLQATHTDQPRIPLLIHAVARREREPVISQVQRKYLKTSVTLLRDIL